MHHMFVLLYLYCLPLGWGWGHIGELPCSKREVEGRRVNSL